MKGNVIVGQSRETDCCHQFQSYGVCIVRQLTAHEKGIRMLYGIQGLLDEQYVDLSRKHIRSDLDVEI